VGAPGVDADPARAGLRLGVDGAAEARSPAGSREMFGTVAQRAIAYLIDVGLMWAISEALMRMMPEMRDPERILPMEVDLSRAWFGVYMAYTTLFEWTLHATPGKWIVGLRLVREDGSPLTLWPVLVRNAVGSTRGTRCWRPCARCR